MDDDDVCSEVKVVVGATCTVVIGFVVGTVLFDLGVLILLSEWLICGCELVRCRCCVCLLMGIGLAKGGMMLVDVAGATWTAPAAVVGAVVIDVGVVVVVGCVFLRSITAMIISMSCGSMASIVARTMSIN